MYLKTLLTLDLSNDFRSAMMSLQLPESETKILLKQLFLQEFESWNKAQLYLKARLF